jgi:hypothetical protein
VYGWSESEVRYRRESVVRGGGESEMRGTAIWGRGRESFLPLSWNPQTTCDIFPVHLVKYQKLFSFAGSIASLCKEICYHMYAKPANNPQTTRKPKFGFPKCSNISLFMNSKYIFDICACVEIA